MTGPSSTPGRAKRELDRRCPPAGKRGPPSDWPPDSRPGPRSPRTSGTSGPAGPLGPSGPSGTIGLGASARRAARTAWHELRHLVVVVVWRALRWRRPWPKDPGEQVAARAVTSLGWEVLDANLRIGHDEGDLLCLDRHGDPILVEVKSTGDPDRDPVDALDREKAACLRRLALALSADPRWPGVVPRIDLITVRLGPTGGTVLAHYRQAVEEGGPPRRRGVLRP